MKIALIVEHADSQHGGAERYTVQLAAALVERGHEVALIAREGTAAPPGVELIILPARAVAKTARYARFLQMIDAHLRENQYDIVHAMMPVHHCDIYHPHAGLAAEGIAHGHRKHAGRIRQKVSRLSNQLHIRRRYFRAVEKKLLQSTHPPIVLCVSELVKREAKQHYPLPDDRLAVLFNAVDLEQFNLQRDPQAGAKLRQQLKISSDKIIALFVAQNFQLKGLAITIAAIAQLRDPRILLLVVGKESPSPYLQQARELGIEKQILFAGSTLDIYAYYSAADFLVLPTMRDSCSLVVLEALAMGLPVISTASNGACEIMTNGQHGFVLPHPKDIPALTEAMGHLIDPSTRANFAGNCRSLRSKLSYDHHLSQMLDIYSQAVLNRSK
ncbi:MAG TPA: glycosyltransferase family 4 protein [Tepidisphaeraceae bacterium]